MEAYQISEKTVIQAKGFYLQDHVLHFWDSKGVLYVDFLPRGTILNTVASYCETLKKLDCTVEIKGMTCLVPLK